MEARGVEPLSENKFTKPSPSAVNLLTFPPAHAGLQAYAFSSFMMHDALKALRVHVLHSFDAPHGSWTFRARRPPLVRQQQQYYCCYLIYKIADFIAVPHRCSLISLHRPRRNLYAPMETVPISIHHPAKKINRNQDMLLYFDYAPGAFRKTPQDIRAARPIG